VPRTVGCCTEQHPPTHGQRSAHRRGWRQRGVCDLRLVRLNRPALAEGRVCTNGSRLDRADGGTRGNSRRANAVHEAYSDAQATVRQRRRCAASAWRGRSRARNKHRWERARGEGYGARLRTWGRCLVAADAAATSRPPVAAPRCSVPPAEPHSALSQTARLRRLGRTYCSARAVACAAVRSTRLLATPPP